MCYEPDPVAHMTAPAHPTPLPAINIPNRSTHRPNLRQITGSWYISNRSPVFNVTGALFISNYRPDLKVSSTYSLTGTYTAVTSALK